MRQSRSLSHFAKLLLVAMALLFARTALAPAQTDTSDPVYEIGNGVIAPRPVSVPDPEYTDKARKKKINGTVVVAMIVTAEGKVRDVKVTKSLDKELDKQALVAVSRWRFEPATKAGEPVSVHLSAEVSFRLY